MREYEDRERLCFDFAETTTFALFPDVLVKAARSFIRHLGQKFRGQAGNLSSFLFLKIGEHFLDCPLFLCFSQNR